MAIEVTVQALQSLKNNLPLECVEKDVKVFVAAGGAGRAVDRSGEPGIGLAFGALRWSIDLPPWGL